MVVLQFGKYTFPESGKSSDAGGSGCGEGVRYSWPNPATNSTQGESWRDSEQACISSELPSLSKSYGKNISDMFLPPSVMVVYLATKIVYIVGLL